MNATRSKVQPPSTRNVVQKVKAALVVVQGFDLGGRQVSLGSGFFLGESGTVVTNLHVIKRASRVVVRALGDGLSYAVSHVEGLSRRPDLCLLRTGTTSTNGLRVARKPAAVGDDVLVAGNPQGLEATFSRGIVSAFREREGLLQIDAAISAGSSGGPVVDSSGDVVGIVVSTLTSGQHLNFAIPASLIKTVPSISIRAEVAGAVAVTDLDGCQARGPVRSIEERSANVRLDKASGQRVEGPAVLRERQEFDRNGMRTRHAQFSNDGPLLDQVYSYDEHGFISATGERLKGPKPISSLREWMEFAFTFRSYDNTIEAAGPSKTVFDSGGCLSEFSDKSEGVSWRHSLATGDRCEWLEEQVFRDGRLDSVSRYSYDVDSFGNWTRRLEHRRFLGAGPEVPWNVVYRNIEYFE